LDEIDEIREAPYQSKSLKGLFKGSRRIKIGDYRIIFLIKKHKKPKGNTYTKNRTQKKYLQIKTADN